MCAQPNRECYSGRRFEGQPEQSLCVYRGSGAELGGIVAACPRQSHDGIDHPRRFVSLSSMRDGRQIRRIRFDQQSIARDQPQQTIVRPFLERDDATERDVPTRIECKRREIRTPRIAVQNADDTRRSCFADDPARIGFSVTRVHHQRFADFPGQRDLRREGGALRFARRVVVVIVETAFADRDGRTLEQSPQQWDVSRLQEIRGIVGMDAGGWENESRIVGRDLARDFGSRQRFSNTDDGSRARDAGAGDYVVAVTAERRVREVGVAVDEDGRLPVLRGHLRSIQRSTGAAT